MRELSIVETIASKRLAENDYPEIQVCYTPETAKTILANSGAVIFSSRQGAYVIHRRGEYVSVDRYSPN